METHSWHARARKLSRSGICSQLSATSVLVLVCRDQKTWAIVRGYVGCALSAGDPRFCVLSQPVISLCVVSGFYPPPGPHPPMGYYPPGPYPPGPYPGPGGHTATVLVPSGAATTVTVLQGEIFEGAPVQTVCPHCQQAITTKISYEIGLMNFVLGFFCCFMG